MLESVVSSLPASFVAAIVLAAILLLALVIRRWQKKSGEPGIHGAVLVTLFAASLVCLAYASVTVVPAGKVAVLSNVDGIDFYGEPLSQGFQFKPPWDNTTEYDDVIAVVPWQYNDLRNAPMHRQISTREDIVLSYLTDKNVDGSYLLANECIGTFNALIKAGQSSLDEFTCKFDDKSFLILRY